MPGYDGTGPAGAGPFTATGKGYCVLKIPNTKDEKQTGYVGLAGKPISDLPDLSCIETAHLHFRIKEIQSELNKLNSRIEYLKRNKRDV